MGYAMGGKIVDIYQCLLKLWLNGTTVGKKTGPLLNLQTAAQNMTQYR